MRFLFLFSERDDERFEVSCSTPRALSRWSLARREWGSRRRTSKRGACVLACQELQSNEARARAAGEEMSRHKKNEEW